jgi:hypothetical protein
VNIKPSLQALWLAEDVTKDPRTGKVSVTGIFDVIEVEHHAKAFTSPAMLFFSLREVHGEVELDLAYTDLSDNRVLMGRKQKVSSTSPLETVDVAIVLHKIPVPHPGEYAWELYWGNEMLGASRLSARVDAD